MPALQHPNRRQAVQSGIAALSATALLPLTARGLESEPVKSTGYIDAHSHIWTRDLKAFPLAKGQGVEVLDPPSFTAEELLEVAKKSQVDRVVLIQHHTYHGWDNSYLLDAAKRYAGRFRVVGMIDDQSKAPGKQMRRLLKQGATGFRITPWIRGRENWLSTPGMVEMWKTAAETQQKICCLIDPQDLEAVDAMCGKHPDTPVVIDHFARIGIDGNVSLDQKHFQTLVRLARHTNTYVKISAYYALGKKKPPHLELLPMIRRLVEAYGAKRLMWLSDSPYQIVGENNYQASIELVTKHIDFVSDAERLELLRGTAERVYFFA